MENASEQLQSGIKPFRKGFVKEVRESAPDQLQSVIWPFHKGFVKENASEQLRTGILLFS